MLEDRHYNHVIARFFSNSRFLIFWNLENVDLHSRMRLSLYSPRRHSLTQTDSPSMLLLMLGRALVVL